MRLYFRPVLAGWLLGVLMTLGVLFVASNWYEYSYLVVREGSDHSSYAGSWKPVSAFPQKENGPTVVVLRKARLALP